MRTTAPGPGTLLLVAAVLCGAGLRAHGDEADDLGQQALAAVARGDAAQGAELARQAVDRASDRSSLWLTAGYARSRAGDAAGAVQAYMEAVRLAPDDPVARNNLGAQLIAQGRASEGLREVEEALRIEPGYLDARNNRGAALERLGRAAEAREAYQQAQGRQGHATALTNLGTLRWRGGDRGGAISLWRRAQQLDPQLAEARVNLVMVQGGEDRLARLEAEAARPGAPTSVRVEALRARAAMRAREGRWPDVLALLEQAHRLAPWDARVLNDMAVAEDQLGRDREALSHLTAALELEPELGVARNNLGIVQVHAGNADLARQTFEDLLERDPRFHRAHYNLGVMHAAAGRLDEAEAAFATAARLAPRDGAVRYNLGLVRRQRGGDLAGERRDYEEALALDPALGEAHLALGMLLADPTTPPRLRDEARAVTHLQRFLDLAAPSDGEGRLQARQWLQWLAERRDR